MIRPKITLLKRVGPARTMVHSRMEATLADKLDRRRNLAARYSTALAEPKSFARARKLHAIAADDDEVRGEIADLRARLAPHRAEHVTRVAAATAEGRAAAAELILGALGDLARGIEALEELNDELRRAGGDAPRIPVPDLAAVRAAAKAALKTGRKRQP